MPESKSGALPLGYAPPRLSERARSGAAANRRDGSATATSPAPDAARYRQRLKGATIQRAMAIAAGAALTSPRLTRAAAARTSAASCRDSWVQG
jgi:hypothetical protein